MKFSHNKENIIVIVSILILVVTEYFILGPLELYAGNRKELLFSWADFFYLFLIVGIIIVFVGGGTVLCLPQRVQDFINYGLFSFAIASYLQALLFNKSIVNINGGGVVFSVKEKAVNAIIWVIVFISILLILLWCKSKRNRIIIYLCSFLTAIQFVAAISIIVTNYDDYKITKQAVALDNRKQFQISNKHNIIVLVLDTFGNELFDEAIESDKWEELLKDFTYYRNVNSGYNCTFPALMYAFSGEELHYGKDSDDYFKDAWEKSNQRMWNPLDSLGYERRLYTGEDIRVTFGDYSNMERSIDNITDIPVSINKRSILKYLGFYSAYKYLPIILKPYFSLETGLLSSIYVYKPGYEFRLFNYDFYKSLKDGIQIEDINHNLISVNHIVGVHPNTMTSISDKNDFSQNIEGKIHDNYIILEEYLSQLKKLDKYDDSDIIIMGDHGSSDHYDKTDYQPLLLIKERNKVRENMEVVNRGHISFSDFPDIVVSLAENQYKPHLFVKEDVESEEFFCRRANLDYMPKIEGSSYNAYYKWVYDGNREELKEVLKSVSPEILPASRWNNGL